MRAYPTLDIATCHNYNIEFKFEWQCVTPMSVTSLFPCCSSHNQALIDAVSSLQLCAGSLQ